jgi:hypothetical protein
MFARLELDDCHIGCIGSRWGPCTLADRMGDALRALFLNEGAPGRSRRR